MLISDEVRFYKATKELVAVDLYMSTMLRGPFPWIRQALHCVLDFQSRPYASLQE